MNSTFIKKLFKLLSNFKHNILDWHCVDKNNMGFDGCSFTSRCLKCNRKILLDSQGNWFSIN